MEELEKKLGHRFRDRDLLQTALTHKSFNEGGRNHGLDNERLEFLGDSVISLAVTDDIYRRGRDLREGDLAKLRAHLVSSQVLFRLARSIGLGGKIRLGRGEILTGGANKDSILADTMEALIGAVYLSAGRDAAQAYVHRLVDRMVLAADAKGAGLEWKMSLQDLCAERGLPVPTYVHEASGPDHDKRFEARACIDGVLYAPSIGRSKKEAEQGAAELAYEALNAAEGTIEAAEPAAEG